jgi:hypothetical protein
MNALIAQLANQAKASVPAGLPVNEWIAEYNQIFAELIVQECANLYTHDDVTAPVGQSAYGEAYQDGWVEGTKAYRETILEHFGVKS